MLFGGGVEDLTIRQCLLKYLYLGQGELRVPLEMQLPQLRQSGQATHITDLIAFELQIR